MNIGVVVLLVVISWTFLSIIVALAVGGMAKARDAGVLPHLDHGLATGRLAPPVRDEAVRTAV
jgi:hypothetical protein